MTTSTQNDETTIKGRGSGKPSLTAACSMRRGSLHVPTEIPNHLQHTLPRLVLE